MDSDGIVMFFFVIEFENTHLLGYFYFAFLTYYIYLCYVVSHTKYFRIGMIVIGSWKHGRNSTYSLLRFCTETFIYIKLHYTRMVLLLVFFIIIFLYLYLVIGSEGEMVMIQNISRYCDDIYECSAYNGEQDAVSRIIRVTVECKKLLCNQIYNNLLICIS